VRLWLEPAAGGRWPLVVPLVGSAPVLLLAAGLALGGGAVIRLCPLHVVTGVPCPACGGTRAAMALFRGAPGEAFALNPLVTVALPIGLIAIIARLVWQRRIAWEATSWERRALIVFLVIAVAANEAWLISAGI